MTGFEAGAWAKEFVDQSQPASNMVAVLCESSVANA